MLTVDFGRLGLGPGHRLLDVGCGGGRHAAEAHRRGAHVVAVDRRASETAAASHLMGAMRDGHEAPREALGTATAGDVLALPFPDASFDRAIASEVLEHVTADDRAAAELARVLRPGGILAVSVPRWLPERICWALCEGYHAPGAVGGHVRIYRARDLAALLRRCDLELLGSHHAHALHSPYWWLKCALGLDNDGALPVRLYHRFLVWDITAKPAVVRLLERALNPLLGKSLVLYLRKGDGGGPA